MKWKQVIMYQCPYCGALEEYQDDYCNECSSWLDLAEIDIESGQYRKGYKAALEYCKDCPGLKDINNEKKEFE